MQMHPLSVLLISGHGEFETGLFQFDPGMHALHTASVPAV